MADWPTQNVPIPLAGKPAREPAPSRSSADAVFTARSPSFLRFANPLTMWRRLWAQRGLIWQFTVRDVQGRYRGSFLGLFWSFFTPLLMLSVYTFIFGYVFNSWQSGAAAATQPAVLAVRIQWVLKLFCGLIVFGVFSECVTRAPGLIVGAPNYVKKVVFPLEILPVAALGASLIHAAISMGLLLAALLVFERQLSPAIALFPLVLLSLIHVVHEKQTVVLRCHLTRRAATR
ncbi:MAG: ABC transporter permease [Candidatus Sumerlaeota bacterium]|nr:ABC transporter permease [Candidatus Sumerlaeota bacterium]